MDIRTELKDLMKSKDYSIADVANIIEVGKSTLSMWINGTYNGDNSKLNDKIKNFIQREKERVDNREIPFVETSIVQYITEIGRLCHTEGKIGVCVGRAGLGKTVAVKNYTKQYLDAILIESNSTFTPKALLLEFHDRLSLSGKGTENRLFNELVHKLFNSGRLIIIDEAENLPYRALEIVRHIHDKTGTGVLLVGKNKLYENLCGHNFEYDQLYSRVKYYKRFPNELPISDIKKILEAIGQDSELAKDYLEYSDGVTRKIDHLISHSTYLAHMNGKDKVDSDVIEKTSELLMAKRNL